ATDLPGTIKVAQLLGRSLDRSKALALDPRQARVNKPFLEPTSFGFAIAGRLRVPSRLRVPIQPALERRERFTRRLVMAQVLAQHQEVHPRRTAGLDGVEPDCGARMPKALHGCAGELVIKFVPERGESHPGRLLKREGPEGECDVDAGPTKEIAHAG